MSDPEARDDARRWQYDPILGWHKHGPAPEPGDALRSDVCPECGEPPIEVQTERGPVRVDACFGGLLGRVTSACCGHGRRKAAYIRILVDDGHGSQVDICGGQVIDYRDFVDRREQIARLIDLRLSASETSCLEKLLANGWHLREILDSLLAWRREGHPA